VRDATGLEAQKHCRRRVCKGLFMSVWSAAPKWLLANWSWEEEESSALSVAIVSSGR